VARTLCASSTSRRTTAFEGIANHFLGELAHARQIDVGLDARMPEDAERALGDVDGLIADALEIVVDAGNSQDEAEIGAMSWWSARS